MRPLEAKQKKVEVKVMERKELFEKTTKELREIAKCHNIPGRWDMTKEELVEAIVSKVDKIADEIKEAAKKEIEDHDESAKKQDTVEAKEEASDEAGRNEVEESVVQENELEKKGKLSYLRNIKKGTIVAFRVKMYGEEKVKSAAVENVSQKRGLLKLVTKYGAEFIVPFEDVVWVRTNSRWPKGVYELLKGIKKEESENESKE